MKQEISLSQSAVNIINEILSHGSDAHVSLVGRRLRIVEQRKGNIKYDVMIPDMSNSQGSR